MPTETCPYCQEQFTMDYGTGNCPHCGNRVRVYDPNKKVKVNWGINIGGLQSAQGKSSEFKQRGKQGSGGASKSPLFDVSSIVKEANEYNQAYWKEEIETMIKEFGINFLSNELKEMAKTLGIKKGG